MERSPAADEEIARSESPPPPEEEEEEEDDHSTSTILTDPEIPTLKEKIVPILIGQVASALICLSGITSIYLTQANGGSPYPSTQNFLSYLVISLVYTPKLAYSGSERLNGDGERENFKDILKSRGWKYFLIALSDVGGNYLVVKAYQYTSLTSVQLLDCFSIPTVLALSYIFLKVRYGSFHYWGVLLCLGGVGFLIAADVESGRTAEGSNPLIGDLLCLAGAFLYGVSNVSQEFFVKTFNPTEFLGCVGLMGVFISAVQTLMLEPIYPLNWTTNGLLLLLAFAVIQFLFYSIVARLMVMSSSLAVNLSILSADFYSIMVGVFVFKYNFSILYFLSFVLVIGGVGIFYSRKIVPRSAGLVPTPGSVIASSSVGSSSNGDRNTSYKQPRNYGTVSQVDQQAAP